ncbi:hypothetical protein [Pseudofrankia asymbiotica]|uniref:ESX-1 secretion-associated protein n=1 Tax=Pseudofrankia asymbiotica TaxID=1834516 RepID=A0A1V2I3U8_9ACTN|nr:hypothetical protein [Pseudofrankia asymbiotica]ONH23828.1 hypothetical protein BL253_31925 [Pseudofrankia asymbiotica]
MSTTTGEAIDVAGAKAYLTGLRGNITHTATTEIETLLAGLAEFGFGDTQVIGAITSTRDLLTSAIAQIDTALSRLGGVHSNITETVAAAGHGQAARNVAAYEQH